MGRAELLFGVIASDLRDVRAPRHPWPDGRLPLRMQARGRSTAARWRLSRRARLWRHALRSPGCWRRTSLIAMSAVVVQTFLRIALGHIILFAALAGAVALLGGAWAHVSLLTEQFDPNSN